MPELPPALHDEVVGLLVPLPQFTLPEKRRGLLEPALGGWEGRYDIDWTGAPYPFFQRFVRQAPGSALNKVLQGLTLGEQSKTEIDELCRRIREASRLVSTAPDRAQTAMYELLKRRFSLEELKELCVYLGVDFDDLGGSGKAAKARELVLYLERRDRLPQLESTVRRLRPELYAPETGAEEPRLPDPPPPSGAAVAPEQPQTTYLQRLARELSSKRWQLDKRFVQLTLLLDQGPEAQGLRFTQDPQRARYDSLATLLEEIEERVVVLLGGPGSGKTTLLRRLQYEGAWQGLEALREGAAAGQTPFFLSLNGYRGAGAGEPPEPSVWLRDEWRKRYPQMPAFDALFQSGGLLLLLDGLNEMPHRDQAGYQARIEQWRAFLQQTHYLSNSIVFSCRSLDYSASLSSEALRVPQVRVEPLMAGQIETFLRLQLGQKAGEVWDALRQDAQQMALFATPFFLQLLADEAGATGEMVWGQAGLLSGFVRRALYREVVERRHRLFRADALLSEHDVRRVNQGLYSGPYDLPEEGALLPQLAALAYAMQDKREGSEGAQVRVPEREARELLARDQAGAIINAGVQLNVLDKEEITGEISFYHQLLQEYFAARVLKGELEPARLATAWRAEEVRPALADTLAALAESDPLPALPATGWEETAILAAAMTADQEAFVAALMPVNLPLAARCAAAVEVNVSAGLAAALQRALIGRIGDPEADLRARIAAAEALGELGDPRFERRSGPYEDYLRPPLVAIAAGIYPIGDDESAYADEKPAHEVAVAAFEMGRFPVTNAEYELFMRAGGYEEERWWETEAARAWLRGESGNESLKENTWAFQAWLQGYSDEELRGRAASADQFAAWLWLKHVSDAELEAQLDEWLPSGEAPHQPAFWDDGRSNHPAQPVVGVSWHEARAYCAWLSAQTGDVYRLPSEAEWEVAARGSEGRAYACGSDFDSTRGNTSETHIRRTTPVGVFPNGLTPEGIADLSGNVWEWTRSIWGRSRQQPDFVYPYVADDGREDMEDGVSLRVVRGGSWGYTQGAARAACRYFLHPASRYGDFGFRVVVHRLPSQDEH